MCPDIIYFEVNNWEQGETYPNNDPFHTWMNDNILQFSHRSWVQSNKICVTESIIDQSINYCVTATKEWVLVNCPCLLSGENDKFIIKPSIFGSVHGKFGNNFRRYKKENFNIIYEEELFKKDGTFKKWVVLTGEIEKEMIEFRNRYFP